MGQKMPPLELELYKRVDEVLYYVWDPIGVSTCPAARDEYQRYLPEVFAMLQERLCAPSIEAYLNDVVTTRMCLEASPAHSKRVVELLLDWKIEIYSGQ